MHLYNRLWSSKKKKIFPKTDQLNFEPIHKYQRLIYLFIYLL